MKQEKGITLIALVITIIVLLILAGVTIAMLTADSSAPQKATEAAQKDAISELKDNIAMQVNESLLSYYDETYVTKTTNKSDEAADPSVKVNAAIKAIIGDYAAPGKGEIKSATYTPEAKKDTNGTITIKTKDYQTVGTVKYTGAITWVDGDAE